MAIESHYVSQKRRRERRAHRRTIIRNPVSREENSKKSIGLILCLSSINDFQSNSRCVKSFQSFAVHSAASKRNYRSVKYLKNDVFSFIYKMYYFSLNVRRG